MTETAYTYSIQLNFPNSEVDPSALQEQIRSSAIVIALSGINTYDGYCDIVFKDALSNGDKTTLDSLVNVHDGVSLVAAPEMVTLSHKTTDDSRLRVAIEKSDQSSKNFYTHNWCDKTTWYESSVLVTNEAAVDSGDQQRFSLAHAFLIDSYHGKISKEDDLLDSDGYSYRASVKVDNDPKVEQDPHYGVDGDYTINYRDGYIDFLSPQSISADVRVTYHYATNSVFTIKPEAGKKLSVGLAEVQFSEDVDLKDTVRYEVYGLVDVFAPQLTPSPYPSGTMISIRKSVYKTMNDFQNDAMKAYATYPPIGGSSWRGMQQSVLILDWDYVRESVLDSSAEMEVRLFLEHNEEFGGSFGTATFYCAVSDI